MRLKQLRLALKTPDLTDLEKSVIKLVMKDHTKQFKTTRKVNVKEMNHDLEEDMNAIKTLTAEKTAVYKNVKKTMKYKLKKEHKK